MPHLFYHSGIEEFIRLCTLSYGKLKLVLKQNRYFVETVHPDVMQTLLKDEVISQCRLRFDEQTPLTEDAVGKTGATFAGATATPNDEESAQGEKESVPQDIVEFYEKIDRDEDDEAEVQQKVRCQMIMFMHE